MPSKEELTLKTELDELKAERGPWDNTWTSVSRYFLPKKVHDFLGPQGQNAGLQSQPNTERLYNAVGFFARDRLASFLSANLINPAVPWFGLQVENLGRQRLSKADLQWQQDTQDAMMAEFNIERTGFHPNAHEMFEEVTALGTGPMFIGERDGRTYFQSRPLSGTYIMENAFGEVDTAYMVRNWTYRQARQFYGDALPSSLDHTRSYDYIMVIRPVEGRNGMWESVHFMDDPLQIIRMGTQYHGFPLVVPRWEKVSGEAYGRSPAMNALPEVRMLQKASQMYMVAVERNALPSLVVPDDGFMGPLRTAPNALNYMRTSVRAKVEMLPVGSVPAIESFLEQREGMVLRMFYVDMFMNLLMRGDKSPLKAEEVQQRTQEAMLGLTPVVARMQQEFLAPLIDRVYGIMERAGRIPTPPGTLQNRRFHVSFISPAALAQRASEANAIARFLQLASPIFAADEEALQALDGPRAIRRLARILNAPADLLRSETEVQQRVEQKRQAAQAIQAAEAVSETAQAAASPGAENLMATLGASGL